MSGSSKQVSSKLGLKGVFQAQKKSTYQTRSKRKLQVLPNTITTTITTSKVEVDRCVSPVRKINKCDVKNDTAKQSTLLNYLTPTRKSRVNEIKIDFLSNQEVKNAENVIEDKVENIDVIEDKSENFINIIEDKNENIINVVENKVENIIDVIEQKDEEIKLVDPIKKITPLVSSSIRNLITPNITKQPLIKTPSFLLHHSLKNPNELLLPYDLDGLMKNFKFLFHTMLFHKNRLNVFNLMDLKPAIESVSKRTFDLKQLNQMEQLMPNLFELEVITLNRNGQCLSTIQIKVPSLKLGTDAPSKSKLLDLKVDVFPISRIDDLCNEFKSKLIEIVHKAHNDYLLNKGLPTLVEVPSKWHPSFDLNNVKLSLTSIQPISQSNIKPELSLQDRVNQMKLKMQAKNLIGSGNKILTKLNGPSNDPLAKARALLAKSKASLEAKKPIDVTYQQRRDLMEQQRISMLERLELTQQQRQSTNQPTPSQLLIQRQLQHLPTLISCLQLLLQPPKTISSLLTLSNQIVLSPTSKLHPKEVKDIIKLASKVMPNNIKIIESKGSEYVRFLNNSNNSITKDLVNDLVMKFKTENDI